MASETTEERSATGGGAGPARPTPPVPSPVPHPAVRRATGARYAGGRSLGALGTRASESDDPEYRRSGTGAHPANLSLMDTRKSPIYSLVTLLPVLMLVAGLFIHYRTESVQSHGAPIRAESVTVDGTLDGLSVVSSGGEGRHFLWFDEPGRGRRGARLSAAQARALHELVSPGDELELDLAPTVDGSPTLWLWRVRRDDEVLLDDSARLR